MLKKRRAMAIEPSMGEATRKLAREANCIDRKEEKKRN